MNLPIALLCLLSLPPDEDEITRPEPPPIIAPLDDEAWRIRFGPSVHGAIAALPDIAELGAIGLSLGANVEVRRGRFSLHIVAGGRAFAGDVYQYGFGHL